jgi:preprotein translocase subunit SecA
VNKFKGMRGMHFVTEVSDLDGQDVVSDVISTVVEIAPMHKTRRPMLVGTTSGEQCEDLLST